jgi:hypothetical protein
MEGNIFRSVWALLFEVIVVLKVRLFGLDTVCFVPKDGTLDGLIISCAPICV